MPKLIENYRDDIALRKSFFSLVKQVFGGLDFEPWYKMGFWTDDYVPFSFIEDHRIVANVSASRMQMIYKGESIRGIQFGTVSTLPEYRNKGYSRQLMNHVLEKYLKETDIFFLFANETVTDFYPKFGMKHQLEYLYNKTSGIPAVCPQQEKLNLSNKKHLQLIKEMEKNRLPLTKTLTARNYGFITFWHMLNVFPEDIYYLGDEELIVIYTVENDVLHIWDMIYTKLPESEKWISSILPNDTISSILFHFPPDQLEFSYDEEITDPESLMFIRDLYIPEDFHFKYPVTAQT